MNSVRRYSYAHVRHIAGAVSQVGGWNERGFSRILAGAKRELLLLTVSIGRPACWLGNSRGGSHSAIAGEKVVSRGLDSRILA